ncbi:hypothetical protein EJB05_48096 [Eragrostis curvula]|uniref:Uncharacterized protein n=1 Tax=Eragrostis curvula TaxID=38414 RepID=A0A5J9T279_9POAL|nr:hypothetical protein EJB05_48096 [Eragrostis curvula]
MEYLMPVSCEVLNFPDYFVQLLGPVQHSKRNELAVQHVQKLREGTSGKVTSKLKELNIHSFVKSRNRSEMT